MMLHFVVWSFNDFFLNLLYIHSFYSKVPRPDKLAVHVFEVDEDVDKDEVSLSVIIFDLS